MFDIDGTLVESYDIDAQCFIDAVQEVMGLSINSNWADYEHVTDEGILNEVLSNHGISNRDAVKAEIKRRFIQKLEVELAQEPVREIKGAASFLHRLQSMENVVVSLATGGWRESATLKLRSANIDYLSIPMASSDDHYSRTEIMKLAASRAAKDQYACTYFGDGIWDQAASAQLGFNFVLVGDKLNHHQNIMDFQSIDTALAYAGLSSAR